MPDKLELGKFGPQIKTDGKIRVIVSGQVNIKVNNPKAIVERKR